MPRASRSPECLFSKCAKQAQICLFSSLAASPILTTDKHEKSEKAHDAAAPRIQPIWHLADGRLALKRNASYDVNETTTPCSEIPTGQYRAAAMARDRSAKS